MELLTWILLGTGSALILLEIITPGGISFCVGLSTIITGLGYQFNYVTSFSNLVVTWAVLSIGTSLIGIMIVRLFFTGNVVKGYFDEDVDAFNTEVEVRESFVNGEGAVFYSGTIWKARCDYSTATEIRKGDTVRIIGRDNITWIIEPLAATTAKE